MMEKKIRLDPKIESVEAWATPRPGMSLDQLYIKLRELQCEVVNIDRENNRICILYVGGEDNGENSSQ